ncbi:hypothetical protein [Spiroplasma tabanidicola]|uniref:Uncharacterized protein n=1 Tax=Spiroplasma tabanidicola TaxID=324079 RepID=A0A6I6CIM3_9MOLU|nr:hypothetical protein [Spiroplasma tabanidicola]QGS51913.1 hypothetical protein STABA_v1c05500 [Spiroplasma tabanidicola]
MAKRYGFELGEYGLPSSIRKRIDDLVGLSLNPSTINLLTSEFSLFEEETKENIGRYIANLLEIENALLAKHFEKIKQENSFGNSKQELIMKQRQSNLLRIQQIFSHKDKLLERVNNIETKSFAPKDEVSSEKIDFTKFMVTNNSNTVTDDEKQKQKLKLLSEKKRKLELVVSEKQQQINIAKKQYEEARMRNDSNAQKSKILIIKEVNEKLLKIDEAIKKYKSVENIPWEVFMDENELQDDLDIQELRIREHLNKKPFNPNPKKSESIINNNVTKEIDVTKEIEQGDFFEVDDFEDVSIKKNKESKKAINEKQKKSKESFSKTEVIDNTNDLNLINEIKIILDKKETNVEIKKVDKIEKNKKETKTKKAKNIDSIKKAKNIDSIKKDKNIKEIKDTNKVKKISVEKNYNEFTSIINEVVELENRLKKAKEVARKIEEERLIKEREDERKRFERDQKIAGLHALETKNKERIIKKIKKNYKARDKKYDQLKKEKEKLEKELKTLKEKQKIDELRNIEIAKRKAIESTESILKKYKYKGHNLHTIMEKKWVAFNIKSTLFVKEKAIKAMKLIKIKDWIYKNKEKVLAEDKKQIIEKNKKDKSESTKSLVEKNKKVLTKLKSLNYNNKESVKNNLYNEEKRLEFLQRKKSLNIINSIEVNELQCLESKINNKNSSNKINLKKYKLIKKEIF